MNGDPATRAGRVVINFRDWPVTEAMKYPEVFDIVSQRVKPKRAKHSNSVAREKWWLFMRSRLAAYDRNVGKARCFAAARTTKYLAFCSYPTDWLLTDALNFFTTDRWDFFAVVQSTIHEVWARKYSGALKQDLRYSPSKCFETFPFPGSIWSEENIELAKLGETYHEHRKQLMLSLWLGLTNVYNLFHDENLEDSLISHFESRNRRDPGLESVPAEYREQVKTFDLERAHSGVLKLRELHIEMDQAVRDAYGWSDIDLNHSFYEVDTLPENDRVRFTINPEARKELLKRLLKLNHERAAEEAAKASSTPSNGNSKKRKKKNQNEDTLPLFENIKEAP